VTETPIKKGRERDASKAREAILDAAEAVFAEHGFDGARIDVIAKASTYNPSLLFQYFGDKLGLYAAVLRRFARQANALSGDLLASWLADETIASDRRKFRAFLETLVQAGFDYLIGHPQFLRLLTWEMAEGWQTFAQVAAQPTAEGGDPFEALFAGARQAGLLRLDLPASIQLTMVFQACHAYFAFLPMYQMQLPGEDLSSAAARVRARDSLVTWVTGAMLVDFSETRGDIQP
jgi:TetR/AcrR family transcriptional regulator